MVYRLVRFNLGSGKLDAANSIFNDLLPQISAQNGFKSVVSFGDKESGDYGFAIVWDSVDASIAAKSIIGPKLSKLLTDYNASSNPFTSELFELLS